MHRLVNGTQPYDWGSTEDIPRFLGTEADGRPVAEIWIGTHPLLPSRTDDGAELTDVSGRLPFLLKVLAAGKPLSLQVHPDKAQAEAGFAAEDAAGIPLDAPHRTFRDDNHKPEMAYALTPFESLVGFRPVAEVLRVLRQLQVPLADRVADRLAADPTPDGLKAVVGELLEQGADESEVGEVVDAARRLLDADRDVRRAYRTAVDVGEHFRDVGVVVALMLNRVTLAPGDAAFLEAGVIHAHLSGLCLEVMAASDNVLRAGLTPKHVDPAGLVALLADTASASARVVPEHVDHATTLFAPPVDDFALALVQTSVDHPEGVALPASGHRLVLCTHGEVEVVDERGGRERLRRGDSVYAGPDDGVLRVVGDGEVAQAFQPA